MLLMISIIAAVGIGLAVLQDLGRSLVILPAANFETIKLKITNGEG
jgi:hypothetical protein